MVSRKMQIVFCLVVVSVLFFFIYKSQISSENRESFAPSIVVMTYSSFTSDYGPGEKLASLFKKNTGIEVKFKSSESALTMLAKVSRGEEVDIVIGLDRFSKSDFSNEVKWREHGVRLEERNIFPELEPLSPIFLPINWAPMAFLYNKEKVDPPKSLEEMFGGEYKVSIPDPRFSSPGKTFLFWLNAAVENYEDKLDRISKNTRWSPSWSAAYSLFQSGNADAVFTYLTSIVYHKMKNQDQYAVVGLPLKRVHQIEYAGLIEECMSCENARLFMKFLVSSEAQSLIMNSNYMLPVDKNVVAGSLFAELPEFTLVGGEEDVSKFTSEYSEIVKKWKSASRK